MIDGDVLERVLSTATRRGAAFAEVFAEDRRSTGFSFDEGRVDQVTSGRDRGAGVRVVVGPVAPVLRDETPLGRDPVGLGVDEGAVEVEEDSLKGKVCDAHTSEDNPHSPDLYAPVVTEAIILSTWSFALEANQ